MKRSRKNITIIIKRGLPLLMMMVVLSFTFSAYALLPDYWSNCTKLGIAPNQKQDGQASFEWISDRVCPSCGEPLYRFSHNFGSTYINMIGAYFFVSITSYGGAPHRYSDAGKIMGSVAHVYGDHDDSLPKWYLAADGPADGSYGYYVYTHNPKTEGDTYDIFAVVMPDHESYSIIEEAWSRCVIARGTVNTYYLSGIAVAFFAVPIYQDAIESYYQSLENAAFLDGYNDGFTRGVELTDEDRDLIYQDGYADGQINASNNFRAFQLFDDVFGGVTDALMPLLEFELYGVSILTVLNLFCTLLILLAVLRLVRG